MSQLETTTDISSKRRFQTVTRYLGRYRGYLMVGGVSIVLSNVLILIVPYVTKHVFDQLEQGSPSNERLQLVLLMLGLAVASGVFRFLTRRTVIWMSRWLEYDLRAEVFAHLSRLSPSFFDNNRTGDLMVRLTSDIEAVRMMIGPGIMHITNTVVTAIVAISFMLVLAPKLTLYALIPMIVVPVFVNRLGNMVHQRAQQVQDHYSELTAEIQENIAGVRVIKAFRQEPAEVEHFRGQSRKYLRLNMGLARLNAAFGPLLMLVAAFLTLVVLYFGGSSVLHGTMPLGTLVAFFAYVSMLFWPAIALGWVVSLYQRGTASLDRINRILHTPPAIDPDCPGRKPALSGKIEFCNLTFAYDDRPVLRNIDLTIQTGQTIGIIGPTGSGKSTLVSLLARLYPVDPGQLFIDDIDINDWDVRTLRSQIGFATQEPFLFSDTVGNNVQFGAGGQRSSEIPRAAQIAALDKDIDEFPDRYETLVGERGITLSGGQKQRTAIARAILVEPRVLILDDATSSVDTETESQINKRLKSMLTGRTSIIISHRVASVKNADQIVYLDDGRIAEQGSHADLITLDKHYAQLHRAQLIEEELRQL